MLSLIILYKWTVVAGLLAAPTLALLGCQLATRDRSMQTLCVGQGAMVGVLIGMGVLHSFEDQLAFKAGPLVSALLLSALTYLLTDRIVAKRAASKNTYFSFVFALLMASGSLVSSVFPALESHMAQVYFGDLATLSINDSQVTIIASLICLSLLILLTKSISNQSFEWSVFGNLVSTKTNTWGHYGFKLITLVVLCFSVQFVGFLFTIAMLFLPTSLMSFLNTKGLRVHLMSCGLLSSVSAVAGFLLSLKFTRLPTVPLIVAIMFGLGLTILAVEQLVITLRTRVLSSQRKMEGAVLRSARI